MFLNVSLKQFKKYSLERKFTFILAKKIKGNDVKTEMDTFSKEELKLLKEWVAKKKEEAEEKIWKEKQAKRAANPHADDEIIFNTGE